MNKTKNGCHQQDFGKTIVEANCERLHLPCRICIRKACFHWLRWCTVAHEKLPKVTGALLILWPICRGKRNQSKRFRVIHQTKSKQHLHQFHNKPIRLWQPFFAFSPKQNAVSGNQNSERLPCGTRLKVGFGSRSTDLFKTSRLITCKAKDGKMGVGDVT